MDAAEVLEPAEHAFDGVAVLIEERREDVFPLAVGFGRNVRPSAPVPDLNADGVGIIALVGVQDLAGGKLIEEFGAPATQSATFPPVSRKAMGRPSASVRAWIFVVRPPRERPTA